MIHLHARKPMHASSLNGYAVSSSGLTRGLMGLLILSLLSSCATDAAHKQALKQVKEGPVEEGVAKLKESSLNNPDSKDYRVDYLRERERVVNQLLLEAVGALSKGDTDAAEGAYQRVLTIDSENAQAKLGLTEVSRSRRHADAIANARDAMDQADYKSAMTALNPVLIENPQDTEAQNLNQQIDAARYTGAAFSRVPELGDGFKKPVSLQFKDTNLKMIFEAISKTSGLNILFDKDIKNDLKATVFVKQASVEDTINLILMQNQLEKKILNENTLYLYPATPAKLKEFQDLVIRTFQLTNADAKQIQTLLKSVLKAKDLYVNEKANSIVIRDTPDVVALAAKLIAAQDVNEPEVMLEMEVLEVTRNLATNLGLTYPDQVSINLGSNIKTLHDWKDITSKDYNVTGPASAKGVLGVTLNMKKTDGEINTLANPRIRVRQREKAKIHIGQRYPIVTTTTTPTTGNPVQNQQVQYIDLGLKLEVEPDIHMDGDVGIKTALEVSSLGTETLGQDIAPAVNTRVVNTVLRLKDGETQILGGLINNEDRNTTVKVPGLGDIPLFGKLFSSNKKDKNKTELILAITPHIIRNIRQPDADLAAYWSGTDATVRSRPITAEKIETIKLESKGALPSPSANNAPRLIQPVVTEAPENATSATPAAVNSAISAPASDVATKPLIPRPVATPLPAKPVPSVHVVVPSSPGSLGSAGMSDATVDTPTQ